ncbi:MULTISPECIES: LysR family transcriptional regulator [Paraburkholderia]|uniref:LysR family transcriptional regulator n=1 Tax=Paraburkholderia TaxID=1822464 RepID=UPI002257C2CE|nr:MULTISPECIES: LysR family transcriptional regulator [Paraburkholderia]MCX4163003.1 LysR family transcriptional regulator [Paraburkholderia megapolitana]MDN7158499.1 LysR family transcriptional regulator [Paraburkholderia sp. CHISQ3]MDQ6495546.1 LysR family transcriptional regulator [Paraburkholderia megapolitana]
MVDLNDIALFVQVVRAGSFAEAARRVGIPANTASRRVQELERDLGIRLLQRSTRRLTLTDAGQTFFTQCVDQIEALTQSALDLAEGSEVPRGKVRVAAVADFLNWFPVAFVAEFLATYPKVQLEFVLSDMRADLLGEGIDIAFRAGKEIEPHVVARQIGWGHYTLVASPAYIDARGIPDSPAALSKHDCITWPTGPSGFVTWQLEGPEGEVEISVTGRFHANNAQAHINAALAGLGIALVPTAMAIAQIDSGRLQRVLPEFDLRVGFYAVYLSRRQLPRAVSTFIDFVIKKMLDQGMIPPLPVAGQGSEQH